MKKLHVTFQVEQKIKKGIKLLEKKDFPKVVFDVDGFVELLTPRHDFLAIAYFSSQNKGVGWVISTRKQAVDQSFFEQLLLKAKKERYSYEQKSNITAYRLFNQEGDGFGGLTIDRYNDFAVFSWYNSFIYSLKDMIVSAFKEVYPEIKGAVSKYRFNYQEKADEGYLQSKWLYGEEPPQNITVLENGLKYSVFLDDGLMTGLFLDQHVIRERLLDGLSLGKHFLNLFSYTASFSVAAAMGGAISTTSVDLAKRSIPLSKAHFKENGLQLDKQRLIVMDVFDYFKYAKRHDLTYDVVLIDPPSFARNKKRTFSVIKDYSKLVRDALALLNPGGLMILSTNASNLTSVQFKKEIQKGLEGRIYNILYFDQLPSDFKINKNDERSNYLKVFTVRVR